MKPDREATCAWDCQLPEGHRGECAATTAERQKPRELARYSLALRDGKPALINDPNGLWCSYAQATAALRAGRPEGTPPDHIREATKMMGKRWTEVLCTKCGGNGVIKIPGGVSTCPRCDGRCYEPEAAESDGRASGPRHTQEAK